MVHMVVDEFLYATIVRICSSSLQGAHSGVFLAWAFGEVERLRFDQCTSNPIFSNRTTSNPLINATDERSPLPPTPLPDAGRGSGFEQAESLGETP